MFVIRPQPLEPQYRIAAGQFPHHPTCEPSRESHCRLEQRMLEQGKCNLGEFLAELQILVGPHRYSITIVLDAMPGRMQKSNAPGLEHAVDLGKREIGFGHVFQSGDGE